MDLFWKIIIGAGVLLVVCWTAYGIWEWRERKLEKQRPKVRTEQYKRTRNDMADYAKKLAEFKSPSERIKEQQEKQDKSEQENG